MCDWTNIQDISMDILDWELTSAESEKHYPAPPKDYTLGTEKGQSHELQGIAVLDSLQCFKISIPSFCPGHFLFLPSSNRTASNENAFLLSPHLPPTKGTCLKFWAFMPMSCTYQCSVIILTLNWNLISKMNQMSNKPMFRLNKCSGQQIEGMDDNWRPVKWTAGVERNRGPVEILWDEHHIFWRIPGQTLQRS